MAALTDSQQATWTMVGEICTAIGAITFPAALLVGLPPAEATIGAVIPLAAGVIGKTIMQNMGSASQAQSAGAQQQVMAFLLQKVLAAPPDKQPATLAAIATLLPLISS